MENGAKEPSPKRLKTQGDDEFSQAKNLDCTMKMASTIKAAQLDSTKIPSTIKPSQLSSKYKDARLPDGWKAYSTVIFNEPDGLVGREKIAAFDFDGCLVNTRVNRHGPDAWSLLYPAIPKKMKSFFDNGYKLVIFTNESNIERWKNSRQKAIDSKIGRLKGFMKLVDLPMQVFISCDKEATGDLYRKPKFGMWNLMQHHFNMDTPVDKEKSFYVGDAAGRPKDHSDADIGFAKAVGVKFLLPEDVFLEPEK